MEETLMATRRGKAATSTDNPTTEESTVTDTAAEATEASTETATEATSTETKTEEKEVDLTDFNAAVEEAFNSADDATG